MNSSGPKEEARVRFGPDPHAKGQLLGERHAQACPTTLCRELRKNGWTDRFVVSVVDSGRPKEAQVHSYSPGGANVPSWKSTLASPGEYTEPFVCGGDVELCQITLTTWPHRSRPTTEAYVDAVYCYRPSIAWSVSWSVCGLSQWRVLQKWLNRSRCRFGWGLGWARETMH